MHPSLDNVMPGCCFCDQSNACTVCSNRRWLYANGGKHCVTISVVFSGPQQQSHEYVNISMLLRKGLICTLSSIYATFIRAAASRLFAGAVFMRGQHSPAQRMYSTPSGRGGGRGGARMDETNVVALTVSPPTVSNCFAIIYHMRVVSSYSKSAVTLGCPCIAFVLRWLSTCTTLRLSLVRHGDELLHKGGGGHAS